MPVTCGPALALLDRLRSDQEDLEATRLEQRKERDPRDPGRCAGDCRDRTRASPGGDSFQVGGTGAEAAHRLGIITRRDRHKVGFGPDINASGMHVGSCQLRW